MCVALLATAVMYCSNDLLDKEPAAARGDGKYRPVMARGDGHMHFLITRSLVFDRDWHLDNDLAKFGDPWNQPRTPTGRKNVMQQVGPSLVWAPLLAVADGAAIIANAFGAGIQRHGYTLFHQRILYASSVAFAWFAIVFGILVALRTIGGRWAAAWAGVAALLGTALTYYATYMPSYAHAMDAAATAGFLGAWALTLGDLRWRRYVVLGLLLGLATLVRTQGLALGVVLALELAVLIVRGRPDERATLVRLFLRGAAVLGIALVMHLPQLLMWKDMYGEYLTTPQGPAQMRWGHPMVLELLFSSRNGWLSTHPIAYLGVLGLVVGVIEGKRLGAHARLVCGALLLAIVLQVYVNAVVYDWWSAASFGQRRLCSMTLPIVVGVAALLRAVQLRLGGRVPRWAKHALAVGVLGYLIAWNLTWVLRLDHAKPAGRDSTPTCCTDVPRPLSWIAKPVYSVIGNPFELPASAVFALRHGVSLQRWDTAVGMYPLVPGLLSYEDRSYRAQSAIWNLTTAHGARYLLGGFGPPQRGPTRTWRWTTAPTAKALLPLLVPEPHRIAIPVAANVAHGQTLEVVIRLDGDEVVRQAVTAAWTTLTFDTGDGIGERVVTIEAAPRAYAVDANGTDAPIAPPTGGPVGVAVGPWRVGFPP